MIELVQQFSTFDFVLASVERLPGLLWIRPEPEEEGRGLRCRITLR